MRLSAYPYVVARAACTHCPRRGAYRLARLAGDCKLRDHRRLNLYDRCGAYFPDVNGSRPPDAPKPPKSRSGSCADLPGLIR